mgnify:CR=1 FL=1
MINITSKLKEEFSGLVQYRKNYENYYGEEVER